jgi:hypothetical protein
MLRLLQAYCQHISESTLAGRHLHTQVAASCQEKQRSWKGQKGHTGVVYPEECTEAADGRTLRLLGAGKSPDHLLQPSFCRANAIVRAREP